MEFIVGGKTINLKGLESSIDDYFIQLHSAHFANQTLDLEKFQKAALEFFDNNSGNYAMQDDYLNNFTVIWNANLSARDFDRAEQIWNVALSPAFEW